MLRIQQKRRSEDEIAIVLKEIRRIQRDPFLLDATRDKDTVSPEEFEIN